LQLKSNHRDLSDPPQNCPTQDEHETGNGAVVRKHIGYRYTAGEHAEALRQFYARHLNSYLNFHRPCGFATVSEFCLFEFHFSEATKKAACASARWRPRSLVREGNGLRQAITVEPQMKGGLRREGEQTKSPLCLYLDWHSRLGGQDALRLDSQEYSTVWNKSTDGGPGGARATVGPLVKRTKSPAMHEGSRMLLRSFSFVLPAGKGSLCSASQTSPMPPSPISSNRW
jgi:hypothetical protein